MSNPEVLHGTTILTVRKGGKVVIGGDGQVTIGQTIIKANAKKVRRLGKGDVIGGFAGATADAFTLFERLEAKLEQHPGQLTRACVELAKDWRTDRYLRRLEAMMIVADKDVTLVLTGTGDVLEPDAGVAGIGSGGNYALAAARALLDGSLEPRRSCAARSISPPTSASTPTAIWWWRRSESDRKRNPAEPEHAEFSPPRDRLRARPLYRRPERRQARGRHRAAQPLAAAAARRQAARGSAAEEYPDDRPDRRRQDGDFAPACQARGRAVSQGRSHQVHRGRLCRPRRRSDRARSGRGRHRAGAREQAPGRAGAGPAQRRGARARRAGRAEREPGHARFVPQEAARRRARRQGDRDRDGRGPSGMPMFEIPGMPGAQMGAISLGDIFGKAWAAAPSRAGSPRAKRIRCW